MADLIEIGIEVRSGSVKSATREIDQLGNSVKSAQRSASAFVAEFEKQERQLNRVVKANQRYADTARQAAADSQAFYKSLQQVNLANKSAANSADIFSKRIEQLKQKYNPLYATSKQYEVMLNEINEAHLVGALNLQQFEAAQERLNQEFTQGTGAFARYQKQFSQGFNQMGVISQQVGYQVGDFLVQVQSGTNPMVAFGQQATQLLGVLYLLPAPIMASTVAIGAMRISVTALIASVSIILPLLTAIGAYFLRSRDAAKQAAEQGIDKYTAALEKLENKVKSLKSERLELTTSFDPTILEASAERLRLTDLIQQKIIESANYEGERKELADELIKSLQVQLDAETARVQNLIRATEQEQKRLDKVKESAAWEEGAADRIAKRLSQRNDFMVFFNSLLERARQLEEERLRALEQADNYYKGQSQSIQTQIALVQAEIDLRKNYTDEQYIQNRLEQIKVDLMAEQNGLTVNQRNKLVELIAQLQTEKELLDDINKAEVRRLAIIEARKSSGKREPVLDPRDPLYREEEARLQRLKDMIESGELYNSTLDKTTKKTKANTAATKDNRTAYEKAMMTATEFADALDQQVLRAVDGVANGFSNFLQNGMRDFKSFVGSIKDMFIRLLADMAAMALKRQILIPIAAGFAGGFGSAAAGATTANLVAGGGMGAALAGGAASLTAGIKASLGVGGFTSAGLTAVGTNAAVATAATGAGASATMATIGAAIPPLIAVAAVFSLFNKKVKELDSGLRVTVDSTGTLVESFRKLETSRLFGLMRSRSTEYEVAGAETADPITEGVSQVQQSILDMANTLGVGSDAFDDFSYQFQVSLKGLSEEQALVKIQEEFTNISDEMAALVPQLSEFAHEGETTTQTLSRLTSDLATVNGAFDRLGRTALEASMDAASAASRLISAAGGQAAFISKTQTLVGAFLDPREQLAYYTKQLQQVSGFEGVPSQEEVKRIFQKGTLEELENLYGGEAINTLQSIFSIQNQLAEEQRRKEEEAARAAAAVGAARQKAEEEAAAAAKAILDERLGLEKQLLELQGNTAELRRLELEAINPANRALQEMIWKLEDAKEAMEGINEVDFKTLFDYQKAVAMARIGQPANISAPVPMPTQSVINGTTTNTPSDTNEGSTVQSDAFVRQSLVEIIKYSKRTSDTLRKFDVDGLPPERT